MPNKDRRIAARQAELAARGRRRLRQVTPMTEPELFRGGEAGEAAAADGTAPVAAPQTGRPFLGRASRIPAHSGPAMSAIERGLTYQNVGAELRKIGILIGVILVVLTALYIALR